MATPERPRSPDAIIQETRKNVRRQQENNSCRSPRIADDVPMNTRPPTESQVQEMMAALALIAQEYTEEERRRAAERVLGDIEALDAK